VLPAALDDVPADALAPWSSEGAPFFEARAVSWASDARDDDAERSMVVYASRVAASDYFLDLWHDVLHDDHATARTTGPVG
jgi:hypothetical protein